MANSIIIRFQPKGDKKLVDAIKKLTLAQAQLEKNTKQVKEELKRLGLTSKTQVSHLRNVDSSVKSLNLSFSTLRSRLLLASFAMSMGGRQIAQFIQESAKLQGMETAFNTLTGATENSSIALGRLKEATDGTMSSFDLFQQANNAMILGVSKNSSEMAEMFDIAQRLGEALGVDTKRSVESLITGIGRQSRLMLDNIGIIVKADEAYESYAKEIGKTADKLTDVEKKQAFLNATMESARKKVSELGSEQETPIKALNRLGAEFDNLKTVIGETAGEAFLPLIQALTEFLRILQDLAPQIKTIIKLASYLAMGWAAVTLHARRAEKALIANRVAANSLKGALIAGAAAVKRLRVALASIGIGLLIEGASRLIGWMSGANDEAEELEINVHNLNNASKSLRDTLISKGFEKYAEILNSAGSSVLSLGIAQNAVKGQMEAFNERVAEAVPQWVIERYKALQQQINVTIATGRTSEPPPFIAMLGQTQESYNKHIDKYLELMKEKNLLDEVDAEIAKRLADEKLRLGVLQETYLPLLEQEKAVLQAKATLDGPALQTELKKLELIREGIAEEDIKIEQLRQEYDAQQDLIDQIAEKKQAERDAKAEALAWNNKLKGSFETMADAMLEGSRGGVEGINEFRDAVSAAFKQIIEDFLKNAVVWLTMKAFGMPVPDFGTYMKGKQGFEVKHEGGPIKGYNQGGIIPGYATGGSVDDVPIMAQEGEFMIRRSAVESIGLENLNRMNRTGQASGGANITFTGNIMSDSFIEEEAIPKIKDAIRRGADLGIS